MKRRLHKLRAEEEGTVDRVLKHRNALARLEEDHAKLRRAVQLSEDGVENFEIAMTEVARVTSAAADMSLTSEVLETAQARAFKDDHGQDRRFAQDNKQNNLIVRLIMLGFKKAVDLFERIRSFTRFNDEIEHARKFPEPLTQMQNAMNGMREAVIETLTQLGVAGQRPDVGELDENGDPPPVLDLVFTRADRKAKKLNNELAVRLGPSGPSMN